MRHSLCRQCGTQRMRDLREEHDFSDDDARWDAEVELEMEREWEA